MNNAAAGVIEPDSGGAVFYKGLRTDDPRVWMYRNEIAAASAGIPGPPLRWVVETEGWIVLGWDHIAGRHADFAPGSPDLELAAAALRELADRPPCGKQTALASQAQRWEQMRPWAHLAKNPPANLDPWTKSNLDRFAAQEDTALAALAGDHLAHTDLHELNILISDGRAHLIDWAWARRAAAWVDAEMFTIRLLAAGHTVGEADAWRRDSLPYSDLDLETRQRFAVEMLGTWLHLAILRPNRAVFAQMLSHAHKWTKHLHQMR
jgi:hypothetical protein